MKYLEDFQLFESSAFEYKLQKDDSTTDYTFSDDSDNKFLVQFKNIKVGNNTLGKGYSVSYFVWDGENWSVSKLVKSNPWKIVKTVLTDIILDFIGRKSWCNKIQFEGLAKELEKDFISQRTKMYLRYLKSNPIPGWIVSNRGNEIILLKK